MSDEAPEVVEKACTEPGCSFVAKGPAVGAGSAGFKLGTHKWRAHGIRSEKPKSRKGGPTDEDIQARPVLSVVRDAANEVGGGKGAPSASELSAGLGRGLGLASVFAASYAADTDPRYDDSPQGDEERERIVERLSLSDRAARELMSPFARAIAPTKLNKRIGRRVVDNVELVGAAAELAEFTLNWRRYFRERRRAEGSTLAVAPMVPGPVVEAQAQPAEGQVAPPVTSPPPTGGVVVTPDMVEAARRKAR